MDDIMTYIKNQDLRVKKLEEENKELKEKITYNDNKFSEWRKREQTTFAQERKENNKLKEENKKLKEQVALAEAGEEEEATLSCRLLEENKQLKEQIKKLRADDGPYSKKAQEALLGVIQETLTESKRLKDQTVYLEAEVCRYSNAIEEEYVLKTDYEELREHCNVVVATSNKHLEENKKLKEQKEK
jgi:hypothetical protein